MKFYYCYLNVILYRIKSCMLAFDYEPYKIKNLFFGNDLTTWIIFPFTHIVD